MRTDTRKPGRPSVAPGQSSSPVCVRLPARMYDAAYQRAREERVSLTELVRRGLARVLTDERER